jgi:flagellar motor switch protein FliN
MPQLTAEQIERTIAACREHLAEMGESFRSGLDCSLRITAAEPRPFAAEALSTFEGPGLAISFVLGEQGLILLIPEPIPLPSWYRQPGISENNRLQTFAHELSLQLLPADLQAEGYAATAAASLKEFAERAVINPTATLLELSASAVDASEAEPPIANILVILPVNATPSQVEAEANGDANATAGETGSESMSTESSANSSESGGNPAANQAVPAGMTLEQTLRALHMLNVPVTVSVRLAERKMPLGQIVALAPGALVPFNKSCEDLLDLFVNNYRYCQGEAIKIGEHFGIKIAKVGVTEERKEHVL